MKKFGPYKGISNNNTNYNKPIKETNPQFNEPIKPKEPNEPEESTTVYVHKPSLDELKRRYTSYIERHQQLSESLDKDEE